MLLFGSGSTPLNDLQQSAWLPLRQFLQIIAVRLHFVTHNLDRSHFKTVQDKLLILEVSLSMPIAIRQTALRKVKL
jgi:hypothetical protein